MLFYCLMSFHFFHFPSNNITEKWCEIDPSVSSFTLRHAHTNQRVCMKCRRQRKWKKNRHMLFLLLQWMKTYGPEVPESYKTCKAGMLLPRTCCHLWLLALPWPQESLETGIHHWGFEKAALGYWATECMKLSLLSYLWCLSALQLIAKWQFLTAFLPSILYIFTLDSLMSVLTQIQISWGKK